MQKTHRKIEFLFFSLDFPASQTNLAAIIGIGCINHGKLTRSNASQSAVALHHITARHLGIAEGALLKVW